MAAEQLYYSLYCFFFLGSSSFENIFDFSHLAAISLDQIIAFWHRKYRILLPPPKSRWKKLERI